LTFSFIVSPLFHPKNPRHRSRSCQVARLFCQHTSISFRSGRLQLFLRMRKVKIPLDWISRRDTEWIGLTSTANADFNMRPSRTDRLLSILLGLKLHWIRPSFLKSWWYLSFVQHRYEQDPPKTLHFLHDIRHWKYACIALNGPGMRLKPNQDHRASSLLLGTAEAKSHTRWNLDL
jgi:hypothetical protein